MIQFAILVVSLVLAIALLAIGFALNPWAVFPVMLACWWAWPKERTARRIAPGAGRSCSSEPRNSRSCRDDYDSSGDCDGP
jgi:hypothetical protein